MNPKLTSNRSHSRGRPMKEWCEHKTDPNLVQRLLRHERYRRNIHAERRQQIRASRLTTRRAIAMLRDGQTRPRDHKSGRCRDVERLRATRARPRRVDEALVLRNHAHSSRAQSFSHSRQLVNRLALRCERHQGSRDLRISRVSIKQRLEQLESLVAAQILAAYEPREEVS